MLGNTFTADRMHFTHGFEKLQQQVQTLLSQIRTTFSGIFIPFLEFTEHFAHFVQKITFLA